MAPEPSVKFVNSILTSVEPTEATTPQPIVEIFQEQHKTAITGSVATTTKESTKKRLYKVDVFNDYINDEQFFEVRRFGSGIMINKFEWVYTTIFIVLSLIALIVLILTAIKIIHSSNRNFGSI